MDPVTLALVGGSLAAAGGSAYLSHNSAKKQARKRQAAIEAAMREEQRLATEQQLNQYRAGGIKSGELLAHLKRLVSPEAHAQVAADQAARSGRVAELAGPAVAAPTTDVARAAFQQANGRNDLVGKLDLSNALLRLQDRANANSERLANVAASRADVPLMEQTAANAKARAANQMNLQAALGGIGPGNEDLIAALLGAGAVGMSGMAGGGKAA